MGLFVVSIVYICFVFLLLFLAIVTIRRLKYLERKILAGEKNYFRFFLNFFLIFPTQRTRNGPSARTSPSFRVEKN